MSDETEYAEVIVEGQRERIRVSRCRDEQCKAPMLWTVGPKGGKIPMDAQPTDKGPYVLVGVARDLRAEYAPEGTPAERRHESHFKTCPAARKFGKKKGRTTPKQDKYVDGPTQPERAEMVCPACGSTFANAPDDANCGECLNLRDAAVRLVRA